MPWSEKSDKQKRYIYAAAARGEKWAVDILRKEGKSLPQKKKDERGSLARAVMDSKHKRPKRRK